jgi:hypothetical protein
MLNIADASCNSGVRNDASFEKDYLGGVYGGIPKTST